MMMMMAYASGSKTRLAVLISGGGSNLKAIYAAIQNGQLQDVEIAVVVSNTPKAKGLEWAFEQGLKTVLLTPQLCQEADVPYETLLLDVLQKEQVDVVVLAGFLRIFTGCVLAAFAGRIVNIHPSLLPAYGGKGMYGNRVHEAVLANQETHTGCTVHLVTAAVDEGEVLGQTTVPVIPTDTVESLAQRVLAQEHLLYTHVLQRWLPTLLPQSV